MIISQPSGPTSITDPTGSGEIVCWLLAPFGYRQNAIYRLTAEQCDGAARVAELSPAVTLVEVRRGLVGWFDAVSTTVAAPPEHGSDSSDEVGWLCF